MREVNVTVAEIRPPTYAGAAEWWRFRRIRDRLKRTAPTLVDPEQKDTTFSPYAYVESVGAYQTVLAQE